MEPPCASDLRLADLEAPSSTIQTPPTWKAAPPLLACEAEPVHAKPVVDKTHRGNAGYEMLSNCEAEPTDAYLMPSAGHDQGVSVDAEAALLLEQEQEPCKEGLTQLQAAATLVTAVLGCGVVALPSLMRLGGWVVVPALACATSLAFMEVACVMDCALGLAEAQGGNGGIKSYEDFGRAAMGSAGGILVRGITTLGFCGTLVVYTILIGQNVHAVLGRAVPMKYVMIIILPVLIGLAMVKDMKMLSKFMPIGVAAAVASVILICVKSCLDAHIWQSWPSENLPLVHSMWPSELQSLGTITAVLFSAFSIMGTVPVIRGNMQQPELFLPTFRASMGFVCVAYVAVMLLGYWGYGNFVQDNVVQSMMFAPAGPREAFQTESDGLGPQRRPSAVGSTMALLVITYLLLGFGLFFACIMGTVQKIGRDDATWCIPGTQANRMLRVAMVIVCILVGSSVPHFREVMSIIAALCCSCNNVFFPLIFAYRLEKCTAKPSSSLLRRARHCGIILLAFFCFIVGVQDSISKLTEKMGHVDTTSPKSSPMSNFMDRLEHTTWGNGQPFQ